MGSGEAPSLAAGEPANDLSQTFAYNPASQIASTVRIGDAYAWTQHFNENKTGTPNGLNQLTAVGPKSLTYDARGNVTAFGTKSFTYSSENLLLTGPSSSTLTYDPAMRLYQVTSGGTTRFAYDGLGRIAEYGGANGLERRYVHGPGVDEPIVWYEGSDTTDRRFLSSDERGSIISVTNSSGALLGINRYDEYGQPQSTNLGVWGYTGQAWLPGPKLWYYKAREFDPELGRFLQTDPIDVDGGINLYAYVGNDPVNFTDPLGLCDGCEIFVIGIRKKDDRGARRGRIDLFGWGSVGGGGGGGGGPIGSKKDTQSESDESTLEKLGRCTADQLGLGEIAEAAAVRTGQPIPGTKRFVTQGSSRGTSLAGMAANKVFGNARLPVRLPTIVGGPGTGRALAVAGTKSVARFAGRAVPIVGWALLAYDVASVAICTASDD